VKRLVLAILALLTFPILASAQAPVLFFTDLNQGTASGNSDTTFSATGGVYVTLYGNNLTGFTSLTLNGASCLTVVSSPATYLWYQRMIVKLGTGCTTGNWAITTPGGTFTGPMPETTREGLAKDFTVVTGHIYYVATGGSGTGTFASPFGTLSAAESAMVDGDVTYVKNGFATTTPDSNNSGWGILNPGPSQCASTLTTQRAMGAYPGATVTLGSTGGSLPSFKPYSGSCKGYEFFGMTMRDSQGVISLITDTNPSGNFRFVANDMSCPGGNGESACAQDGGYTTGITITGLIYLGNNMHDTGTGNNSLYHGYYDGNTIDVINAWGQIANLTGACRGIQVYSSTTSFQATDYHIHDNVIHDTGCDGILFATPNPAVSGLYGSGVEFYNNVVYNAGKVAPASGGDWACVEISAPVGPSSVNIYNNTLYNCGTLTSPPYNSQAGLNINFVSDATAVIRLTNNIIYNLNSGTCLGQTPCSPYIINGAAATQLVGSNNVMFGVGAINSSTILGGSSITGGINSNPGFVSTTNFHLAASTSPANGAGTTALFPTRDHDGLLRPSPPAIGAYEFAAAAPPPQTDIYYANTGQGVPDGKSCATAYAWNDGTNGWALSSKQQPGNTFHICGTITGTLSQTILTAINPGTSTQPITLKFETGAILQSPAWQGLGTTPTGGINLAQNFWVVDGGSNGILQNTANGTSLANQVDSCGIGGHGSNITIKNLTVANIYVHTGTLENGDNSYGICTTGGSNVTITGNTVHDARWAIFYTIPGSTTVSNLTVSGNTVFNMDHGIVIGDGNGGAHASGMVISGNTLHDMGNWDVPPVPPATEPPFHHDYVHTFLVNGGSGTLTEQIYNNYAFGNPGTFMNSFLFVEETNTTVTAQVFNNVLINNSTVQPPYGALNVGGHGSLIVNNTVIGGVKGSSFANDCVHMQGLTYTVYNNTCQQLGFAMQMGSAATTITNIDFNNVFNTSAYAGEGFSPFNTYTLSGWQTACPAQFTGGTECDLSSTTTNPNIQTSSPFKPISPSPLIGAGKNLTSLGITALNTDFNGVARPATGNWDVGAAQSTGATGAPNAPTGLSASVTGSVPSLSWTIPTGQFTGETVYRGTVSGGPYAVVASGLTGSTFTDAALPNGTYFYVVAAFNGGIITNIQGNTPTAGTATVTCSATCTFPTGASVSIQGNSVSQFNGTFTVTGQPTGTTFTFASTTSGTGTGGGAWQAGAESAKSNQATAIVGATLTVSFAPASLTFASTTVGNTTPSQAVVTTNTSGAGNSVTISAVTLTGSNPGDFSISTTNCVTTLASGANCSSSVTFTPTASGARSANLTFTDNASGSPQTVPLSGTGVSATPLVSLTPSAIIFGAQLVSTTSVAVAATLKNVGTGTLSISSISASGDFGETNGCGATLAPGISCTINVTFTPTVTGTRSGALTVTDNASGSPHTVTLSGTGINTKCAMVNLFQLSGKAQLCGP
jgi:parallel beta-helix repeat protein